MQVLSGRPSWQSEQLGNTPSALTFAAALASCQNQSPCAGSKPAIFFIATQRSTAVQVRSWYSSFTTTAPSGITCTPASAPPDRMSSYVAAAASLTQTVNPFNAECSPGERQARTIWKPAWRKVVGKTSVPQSAAGGGDFD